MELEKRDCSADVGNPKLGWSVRRGHPSAGGILNSFHRDPIEAIL
jgi:hypothetical protein